MCSSLDLYTIQGTLSGIQALDGSFSAKVWSLNLSTPCYSYTGLLNCTMYQYTPSASTHWGHKWQGRKMCFIYIFDCPFSDVSSPQLQPIVKAAELAKETK